MGYVRRAAVAAGAALVAALVPPADCKTESTTVVGVVTEGAGLSLDSLASFSDVPRSEPRRIPDAILTVSREPFGSVSVRTSQTGRFTMQVPREWLDELCVLSIRSDDHAGLELPCTLAIGPDPAAPDAVIITLPVLLRSPLLLDDTSDEATQTRSVIAARLAEFRATDNRGKEWTRADFLGHWTLLEFSYTTCGPCRAESRRLTEGQRELARVRLAVLFLTLPLEPKEAAAGMAEAAASPWPRITFSGEDLKAWGVTSYPANVLIAPDGQPVAADIHGPRIIAEIERVMGANGLSR